MSVLDVLMCGWVGGLYLLTVYSMCAYVGGGGGLYLLSVYSMYAYVWEVGWSMSTLCTHMCGGRGLCIAGGGGGLWILHVYSMSTYTVGGGGLAYMFIYRFYVYSMCNNVVYSMYNLCILLVYYTFYVYSMYTLCIFLVCYILYA